MPEEGATGVAKEIQEKTGIIHKRQKNGDIYVYERVTVYSPEKHRNEHVSSRLLGKIPAGQTEMISTRPRRKPEKSQESSGPGELPVLLPDPDLQKALSGCYPRPALEAVIRQTLAWLSPPDAAIPEMEQNPEISMQSLADVRLAPEILRPLSDWCIARLPSRNAVQAVFSFAAPDGESRPISFFYHPETLQPIAVGPANTGEAGCGVPVSFEVLESSGPLEQHFLTLLSRNEEFLLPGDPDSRWILTEIPDARHRLERPDCASPEQPELHGLTRPLSLIFSGEAGPDSGGAELPGEVCLYLHFLLNTAEAERLQGELEASLQSLRQRLEQGTPLSDFSEEEQERIRNCLPFRRSAGTVRVFPDRDAIEEARDRAGLMVLVSSRKMSPFEALRQYRFCCEKKDWFSPALEGDPESWEGRIVSRFVALLCRSMEKNDDDEESKDTSG